VKLADQLDVFPRPERRDTEPRPFGRWSRCSSVGAHLFDVMPHRDRVERVRMWLADRGATKVRDDILDVLALCDSGAEVAVALAFAPTLEVNVVDERTLHHQRETLRLQAPIPHTNYRADFEWTHPRGSAYVEVYGYHAHRARRDSDRARHHTITTLGFGIHYLPAEVVVRNVAGAWPAVRQREQERLLRVQRMRQMEAVG
jgi:very-short-patch-repair endonuclease